MKRIAIVGGGLVGALLAVFLRRRGYPVVLYEARPDPRVGVQAGGRSINLIVTVRGIHALRQVDLWDPVSNITAPVSGRMLHDLSGEQTFQPYGRDDSECNHSVSRGALNNLLLTAAENAGATLIFDHRLTSFDPATNGMRFHRTDGSQEELTAELVFGADGAASGVRAGLMQTLDASESIEMLTHGYKELEFPAAEEGGFAMDRRALHLWPRGAHMLMGLPNPDGSFTGTLYLPHKGSDSFEALPDATAVQAWFGRQYPDAVALLPNLTQEFSDNPTGELGTVRCSPWHLSDRTALIGDAAHAIVPFFGQGMNAGFEDCTVLDHLLEQFDGDWAQALPAYEASRKPNADAIAEMALDNFIEMRDRAGDPAFLLRKQVERRLEQAFPSDYRSRYSMVVYSRMPYAIAQQAGRIQLSLLDRWCADIKNADDLDLPQARQEIKETLTPYLDENGVRLDY